MVSEMVIVNGWQRLPYGNCWVIVEDYMVSEMVIVNGWQCLPYGNCWVIVEDYKSEIQIFWLGTQLGSSGSDLGFHTRPIGTPHTSISQIVIITDEIHMK